jgi:inner membrane protein involved in colicin E2 resistance
VGALSNERSGLSFVSQSSVLVSMYMYIYTVYVQNIIEIVINIQYLQGLCQSRLRTADYALLLVAFATTAVLDT